MPQSRQARSPGGRHWIGSLESLGEVFCPHQEDFVALFTEMKLCKELRMKAFVWLSL